MIQTNLAALDVGQRATVTHLTASGSMRRRLLDIGLTEGAQVECTAAAPSGNPKAFLIRGAVIALRLSDCENVKVQTESQTDSGYRIKRKNSTDKIIALAGNPNVGKSTIFNALTGMRQHTGNWPGKTVGCAQGYYNTTNGSYVMVDLPGTYSLLPHSAEEEAAAEFLKSGNADAAVVVCDATCLERSLNLALQVMELCPRVVICVNLMDEAAHRKISIDLPLLEKRLGVPVIGTSARDKKSLAALTAAVEKVLNMPVKLPSLPCCIQPHVILPATDYSDVGQAAGELGITEDIKVASIYSTAEQICRGAVTEDSNCRASDRKADRLLTSKAFGYPIMILMLLVIFWLTITGSNYPSQLLSAALNIVGEWLSNILMLIGCPEWLRSPLIDGAWCVLAWVVAVMLPPMAIFFPLFTLLEDSGYLPRIAFCLDNPLRKCHACGKQALTMAMGFGCNAVGVTGCRIIDSPRERLIAMLTNSLVPCNGRFPTIVAVLTMFFVGTQGSLGASIGSAVLLTAAILTGIVASLAASRVLSSTLLKGEPSSFTLELPPYRRPQIGKVIVRSVFDRTLFVLGRAAAVAAPAGLIIWLCANITIGDNTLLNHMTCFLDPFAQLLGLDGVILIAFILGIPANEIVVPIIIMTYMAQSSLTELNTEQMLTLFTENGWTWVTAVNVVLFSLMHWPCSTTLLTIKKEAGGIKWAAIGFILPTIMGMTACILFTAITKLFGVQ